LVSDCNPCGSVIGKNDGSQLKNVPVHRGIRLLRISSDAGLCLLDESDERCSGVHSGRWLKDLHHDRNLRKFRDMRLQWVCSGSWPAADNCPNRSLVLQLRRFRKAPSVNSRPETSQVHEEFVNLLAAIVGETIAAR
jgi:hypothetical protein